MRGNNQVVVESFEPRMLMSAAPLWQDEPIAMRAAASVMAVPLASSRVAAIPPVVGNWSGTCTISPDKAPIAIRMSITRQKGEGATGTFSLGPITRGTSLLSTAVVRSNRSFNVVLQGKDFYGSMTATVSANGKYLTGRWCCNNGKGQWQTGTLTMTRP